MHFVSYVGSRDWQITFLTVCYFCKITWLTCSTFVPHFNLELYVHSCQYFDRACRLKTFSVLFVFIFCPKIQFRFPEKIVEFFWVKNSWKCCGFGLFSCWQLWFHEKNCQKKIGMKNSWKCWGICENRIFGQKFDFSNSVLEGFGPNCNYRHFFF